MCCRRATLYKYATLFTAQQAVQAAKLAKTHFSFSCQFLHQSSKSLLVVLKGKPLLFVPAGQSVQGCQLFLKSRLLLLQLRLCILPLLFCCLELLTEASSKLLKLLIGCRQGLLLALCPLQLLLQLMSLAKQTRQLVVANQLASDAIRCICIRGRVLQAQGRLFGAQLEAIGPMSSDSGKRLICPTLALASAHDCRNDSLLSAS